MILKKLELCAGCYLPIDNLVEVHNPFLIFESRSVKIKVLKMQKKLGKKESTASVLILDGKKLGM